MFLFDSGLIFFIESGLYVVFCWVGMFWLLWTVLDGFYRLIPVRFIFFFSNCKLSLAVMILLSVMLLSISKLIPCLGIWLFDDELVLFVDSIRLIEGVFGGSLYSVELSDYLVPLFGGNWVFINRLFCCWEYVDGVDGFSISKKKITSAVCISHFLIFNPCVILNELLTFLKFNS